MRTAVKKIEKFKSFFPSFYFFLFFMGQDSNILGKLGNNSIRPKTVLFLFRGEQFNSLRTQVQQHSYV